VFLLFDLLSVLHHLALTTRSTPNGLGTYHRLLLPTDWCCKEWAYQVLELRVGGDYYGLPCHAGDAGVQAPWYAHSLQHQSVGKRRRWYVRARFGVERVVKRKVWRTDRGERRTR